MIPIPPACEQVLNFSVGPETSETEDDVKSHARCDSHNCLEGDFSFRLGGAIFDLPENHCADEYIDDIHHDYKAHDLVQSVVDLYCVHDDYGWGGSFWEIW